MATGPTCDAWLHPVMTINVGTSGWQYRDWRPAFYPAKIAPAHWLEWYADRFATVESISAFYRLPLRATSEAWRDRTPPDFTMAVKVSCYLTHVKRLREPAEPVARFLVLRGLAASLDPFSSSCLRHCRRIGGYWRKRWTNFPRTSRSPLNSATQPGSATKSDWCWNVAALRSASPIAAVLSRRSGGRPTGPICDFTKLAAGQSRAMRTLLAELGPPTTRSLEERRAHLGLFQQRSTGMCASQRDHIRAPGHESRSGSLACAWPG
jgi:hypothetical protein